MGQPALRAPGARGDWVLGGWAAGTHGDQRCPGAKFRAARYWPEWPARRSSAASAQAVWPNRPVQVNLTPEYSDTGWQPGWMLRRAPYWGRAPGSNPEHDFFERWSG